MRQITNDGTIYVNLNDAAEMLGISYAKIYSKVAYDKVDKVVENSNVYFSKSGLISTLRKMLEKSKWGLTENRILEFSNFKIETELENSINLEKPKVKMKKELPQLENPITKTDIKIEKEFSNKKIETELENSICDKNQIRNYPTLDLANDNISPMFWENPLKEKPPVEPVKLFDKPEPSDPINWLPYIPLFCVMACNAISVFICFSGETYTDTAFAAFIAVALACAVYYAASIDLIPLAALFAVIMFVIHCISFDVFHSYGNLSFEDQTFNNDFLIGLSKSISLCGLEILFSYLVNIKKDAKN